MLPGKVKGKEGEGRMAGTGEIVPDWEKPFKYKAVAKVSFWWRKVKYAK